MDEKVYGYMDWPRIEAIGAWDLYKRYGFRNSGGKSESKIVWIV